MLKKDKGSSKSVENLLRPCKAVNFIKKYYRPSIAQDYHKSPYSRIITNLPVNRSSSLASWKIDRTWFALAIVALTSFEITSAREMRILAIVVLPHLKAGHTCKLNE